MPRPAFAHQSKSLNPRDVLWDAVGLVLVSRLASLTYGRLQPSLHPRDTAQVVLKLIQPYSRIRIPFVSQQLNIPEADVEHLLVSLILDNRIAGHLDQVLAPYRQEPLPPQLQHHGSICEQDGGL